MVSTEIWRRLSTWQTGENDRKDTHLKVLYWLLWREHGRSRKIGRPSDTNSNQTPSNTSQIPYPGDKPEERTQLKLCGIFAFSFRMSLIWATNVPSLRAATATDVCWDKQVVWCPFTLTSDQLWWMERGASLVMTSFRYSPLASEPTIEGPWESGTVCNDHWEKNGLGGGSLNMPRHAAPPLHMLCMLISRVSSCLILPWRAKTACYPPTTCGWSKS